MALLQEKPWAKLFALAGGIGWCLAMWVGGDKYTTQVAGGPSARVRRHGEELGWPADYVCNKVPGAVYDILAGRSRTFSLWPHQDVWDTIIGNSVWSSGHEKWYQAWLALLQGPAGEQPERAIGNAQWWPEVKYGVFPAQRQLLKEHVPSSWSQWAEGAGWTGHGPTVILVVEDRLLDPSPSLGGFVTARGPDWSP